jgi:hypothetical protein
MRGTVPQLTREPRHVLPRERTFTVHDVSQNMSEPSRRDCLVDIAKGAGTHGVDSAVLIRFRRDEHDLHIRGLARENARDLVTPALGHLHVEERQIGPERQHPVECVGSTHRFAADVEAGCLELLAKGEQDQAMVVRNDDRRPLRLHRINRSHVSTIAAAAAPVKKLRV